MATEDVAKRNTAATLCLKDVFQPAGSLSLSRCSPFPVVAPRKPSVLRPIPSFLVPQKPCIVNNIKFLPAGFPSLAFPLQFQWATRSNTMIKGNPPKRKGGRNDESINRIRQRTESQFDQLPCREETAGFREGSEETSPLGPGIDGEIPRAFSALSSRLGRAFQRPEALHPQLPVLPMRL